MDQWLLKPSGADVPHHDFRWFIQPAIETTRSENGSKNRSHLDSLPWRRPDSLRCSESNRVFGPYGGQCGPKATFRSSCCHENGHSRPGSRLLGRWGLHAFNRRQETPGTVSKSWLWYLDHLPSEWRGHLDPDSAGRLLQISTSTLPLAAFQCSRLVGFKLSPINLLPHASRRGDRRNDHPAV